VLLSVAFLVILINQTAQLVGLATAIHPTFGSVVLWGLVVVYVVCLAVPIYLFVRLPEALVPPETEDSPEFEEHVATLRKRLRTNPLLEGVPVETAGELESALTLLDREADVAMKAAGSRVFLSTAISRMAHWMPC